MNLNLNLFGAGRVAKKIKESERKTKTSELEKEASAMAKKYSVSIPDATAYIKGERRKAAIVSGVKKIGKTIAEAEKRKKTRERKGSGNPFESATNNLMGLNINTTPRKKKRR